MKIEKNSIIKSRQYHLIRTFILDVSVLNIVVLILLNLFRGNIVNAEEMGPIQTTLTIDTIPRGAPISLNIKCVCGYGYRLKDVVIAYQLSDDNETVIEKVILWEGNPDTLFNKEFVRSIDMPIGSKRKINVSTKCTDIADNSTPGTSRNIYFHRTSRWTMYGFCGFVSLELEECVRDAEERGINVKEMCIAEIDAIDPLLAYRLHPHPPYDPSQHATPPNPQTYEVRQQGSLRIVQDSPQKTDGSYTCQIIGLVLSKRTGVQLFGAEVKINGTNINATVEFDKYLLKNIPPGIYDITASFKGYENRTFSQVNIKSGYKYFLNFKLVDSVNTSRQVIIRE